jgi:hypothetical protein
MSRAIIFNCELKLEVKVLPPFGVVMLVGKGTDQKLAGAELVMAVLRTAPVLMECAVTPA